MTQNRCKDDDILLIGKPFIRYACSAISMLVIAVSLSTPTAVLAKQKTKPASAVGDPLPRIQCVDGYTATIYAEGLSSPDGLAFNSNGFLYVAEESAGQVSRIEADGSATPVVTGLSNPEGITFDDAGNLYVVEDVENGRLIQMSPDGITTTLASGLDAPEGIVWAGNTLYLTESNVQFTPDPGSFLTEVTAVSPPNPPSNIGMVPPFSPSLASMTQKAIDILTQNLGGFFLMVEGGQIDWASHANEAALTMAATNGLDAAVAIAQTYASIVSNTLIIVTADHETGGMSADLTSSGASNQDGPFQMPDTTPFYINWQGLLHTAADVPTTAQGPWSDLLAGTYENCHIHNVMCQTLQPSKDQVVGHVFRDINRDGTQNTGEPNLAGVSIIITDTLGVTHTATTNSNGHYTVVVPLGITFLDVDDASLPISHTLTTANDPQTIEITACKTTLSSKVGYEIQYVSKSHLPLILKNQ